MPAIRDLNKLMTFVRVAERHSFTRAARDLRMSPSVVSKHISELEDMLGFSLLTRSTHGVALTDAGEGFFRNCLHMLENLEEFVINTRNEETGPYGTLRVQASVEVAVWFLAPLIPAFIRCYPDLRIELVTEAATQNPVEDGCDVILASKKPAGPGLVGRDIGEIRYVICASPDYFRRCGRPEKPEDLRHHNCLVSSPFSPREWRFKEAGGETSVWVKGMLCSNSTAILTQVALEGIGIAKVPDHMVRSELASGKLESIFDDIACSRERIRAYYSKTKYLPAKTTAFVEFLENAFTADLEQLGISFQEA